VRKSGIGRLIAQLLGDKYVTPIYMGLGALPFPTELHYIVGKPMRFPHGPEAAEDPEIVATLHREVTETTQRLIDEGLGVREQAASAELE
jgi:hypothetical protein